jgi:hypothetical protein
MEAGYDVYVNGTKKGTYYSTQAVLSDLQPRTEYKFQVVHAGSNPNSTSPPCEVTTWSFPIRNVTNFKATALSNSWNAIGLSWDYANEGESPFTVQVQYCFILYRPQETDWRDLSIQMGVNAPTTATLDGVIVGSTYNLRAASVHVDGMVGKYSPPTSAVADGVMQSGRNGVPDDGGIVDSPKLVLLNPKSMTLTWSPPYMRHVVKYEVELAVDGGELKQQACPPVTDCLAVLEFLTPGKRTTVSVTPIYHGSETGRYIRGKSKSIDVDVPSASSSYVSLEYVKFDSFRLDTDSSMTCQYKKERDADALWTSLQSGRFTAENLLSFTSYLIRPNTTPAKDHETVRVFTPGTAKPIVPTNVRRIIAYSNSIRLQWDDVEDNTQYTVEYYTNKDRNEWKSVWNMSSGGPERFNGGNTTINKLTAGIGHVFRVTADTGFCSAPSKPIWTST